MTDQMKLLLAAAEQCTGAACDMIAATREGEISLHCNVGSGDTLAVLTDGLRLLLEATGELDEDQAQLHGAVIRFLDSPL